MKYQKLGKTDLEASVVSFGGWGIGGGSVWSDKSVNVADLEKLEERQLLSQDVLVVCETDKEVELPEEIAGLGIWKQKIYGISKVTVYVR